MAPVPDPVALSLLAAEVAAEAGRLLLAVAGARRELVESKSTTTDMVTEMDRRSEGLIVERLRAARPDDSIVAEEGTAVAGTTGVRWVVDPLDGTTNYLYGYPGWNVSIAAEVEGQVVAGAVADPVHAEVFRAAAGAGSWRNDHRLGLEEPPPLAGALVATGFAYEPERRRRQAATLVAVAPMVRDLRRGGAAAVDLCWVACGRVDGYFERGMHPWDWSAGALVATEAGAVVTDHRGGPPSWELVVAASPPLHDELRALVVAAGALED